MELQGCEAEQPEKMEGDNLKFHFRCSPGFRFLICKIENLDLVDSKVPQALWDNCVSSLAVRMPRCNMQCFLNAVKHTVSAAQHTLPPMKGDTSNVNTHPLNQCSAL